MFKFIIVHALVIVAPLVSRLLQYLLQAGISSNVQDLHQLLRVRIDLSILNALATSWNVSLYRSVDSNVSIEVHSESVSSSIVGNVSQGSYDLPESKVRRD